MGRLLFLTTAIVLVFIGCTNNADKNDTPKHGYEIDEELEPIGEKMTADEKKARLSELISESKRTLDSIDFAYSSIRKESRRQSLSLDERENVNEALMELNDAKDLIILEMQTSVVNELKQKTVALADVMSDMNRQSEKMMHMAQTLNRVSGVIKNTTNLLASALTVGLVRPKLNADSPSDNMP